MSSFQQFASIISPKRFHHSANCGLGELLVAGDGLFDVVIEPSDWLPRIENSHPPNQPSLTPPASGVDALGPQSAARGDQFIPCSWAG
jgi:hypothetical protein